MPSSSNRGKHYITHTLKKIISRGPIKNILDIGAGIGTYFDLFNKILPNINWTCIEVWNDYIEKYQLANKYNTVIKEDCRKIDYKNLGQFDLVFAGDVLEHMTKEESIEVTNKILDNTKCLIISIPVIYMPQGEYEGNPYEVHVKDDWSDTEVKETFNNYIIDSAVDNEIGVYILSKDEEFIKQYKKLKIAIYTIAKNEEQFVERWAKSNQEADLRLVCDTGSSDETIEKLKSRNVDVISISVNPWRFDTARNTALNLLPNDIDVCIWQDLDEELLPGWREELEKHWNQHTTANHKYRHNNGAWQWHSKVHARHNCFWTGAVHETLKWTIPENSAWLHEFYLDEHQDTEKSRSNYLNLLLTKIKEGDRNWRTFYFLANDYHAIDINESIKYRIKSYEAVDDDDALVKNYVARNIARQYAILENNELAYKWFRISVDHSNEREAWFNFAEYLHKQNNWDECYLASKKCLAVNERRDGFTYDPNAWSFLVYDFAAISSYQLGLYKLAFEYGEKAIEMNPNDQRLKNNLEFYREKL